MGNFNALLQAAGLTKAELARQLGLKPNTLSKWRDEPPRHAVAYLELRIAHRQALDEIRLLDRMLERTRREPAQMTHQAMS